MTEKKIPYHPEQFLAKKKKAPAASHREKHGATGDFEVEYKGRTLKIEVKRLPQDYPGVENGHRTVFQLLNPHEKVKGESNVAVFEEVLQGLGEYMSSLPVAGEKKAKPFDALHLWERWNENGVTYGGYAADNHYGAGKVGKRVAAFLKELEKEKNILVHYDVSNALHEEEPHEMRFLAGKSAQRGLS